MSTRHHIIRAVAGALLAAGLLVACGGSGGDSRTSDEIASLGTDDSTTETSVEGSTPSKDPEEAMLDFTECMRDHGVDMPDPQTASGGGQVITMEGNAMDNEDFAEAEEACEHLMEAAIGEIERDPEREAEMREQLLEYAQCMRDHGIDMPDPTFDDNGGVQMQMGSEDGEIDEEAMEAANEACGEDGMFMAAPALRGED